MPVLLVSSLCSPFKKNKSHKDCSVDSAWGKLNLKDHYNGLAWHVGEPLILTTNKMQWGVLPLKDTTDKMQWGLQFNALVTPVGTPVNNNIEIKDSSTYMGSLDELSNTDVRSDHPYVNILDYKDTSLTHHYFTIQLTDNKGIPPLDQRYYPNLDFQFDGGEIAVANGFFKKPIDYDILKTPLSPLDSRHKMPWSLIKFVDIIKDLKWGYGQNDFLIGGSFVNNYLIDDDALTDPDVDAPDIERVVRFVNSVNIVTLPARTPIEFTEFKLSYDVESISWVFGMTVPDQNTANLVKPTLLNVVELEININGELFLVFVSKTKTTRGVDESGKTTKRIKCEGNSVHRLLSHPYSSKVSYTDASQTSPAAALNAELVGTGFTGQWDAVTWAIPAGVYSYVDKSPMGAISELADAIGAVIIPDPSSRHITIKPRYPIPPWQWQFNNADLVLNENNFFTIDTEWIPQESADSIYIFGADDNGVGVKCVISGKAGNKTLPSITNKYMTDNVPATQRGLVEVAKNGFIEIVPISTYVDPAVGIIQPLTYVQVVESDGVTAWKALVVSISLSLKRNGNALVQSLQLERHYDDI